MPSISIVCESLGPEEIQEGLKGEFEYRVERVRGIETAIIVALVAATGGALHSLIANVLAIAAAKSSRTVTIRGRTGWEIVVPAGLSPEELAKLIKLAREDTEEIVV